MRRMDDIKSVTGFSVNYLSQLVKDREMAFIRERHSQEEKKEQCLIQGQGNGKLLL